MSNRRRHERPIRRVNPSGKPVWVARWTNRAGKRQSAGTFVIKGPCKEPGAECCAQHAIDAAYDREYSDDRAPRQVGTVESYVTHWERFHPRSPRTAGIYRTNLKAALPVKVGGRELRAWRMDEVERSEMAELLDHLLRVDGRAASGARGVLQTLGTMWEDAISDGWTRHNPVKGLRLRNTDPRIQKPKRTPRVFTWEQMHGFADKAPDQMTRAMFRVLADTGMRLGEMLALERRDIGDEWITIRQTARDGSVTAGTKTTRESPEKGRQCPLPPSLRLILRDLPPRLDTRFLFPGGRGRPIQNTVFYEHWQVARDATGMTEANPHDFRHSHVTLMRAAGVDPADLAEWTGHTVATATASYTHSVGATADLARSIVG